VKVPELWAIINLTPDSFYAGSRASSREAVERSIKALEAGAAMIDVGAESTRPGAQRISSKAQLGQIEPYLIDLKRELGDEALGQVSIDTRDIEVMRRVLDLGVSTINDVSGGTSDIYKLVAASSCDYVLMHTQGTPQNMQVAPAYSDVIAEIRAYLLEKTELLVNIGVAPESIIWDTGIGFGKTVANNLQIIAAYHVFQQEGYRTLAGVSRKSFLGKITGAAEPETRLAGTLAAQMYLTLRGCDILRVHDVQEMADVLKVYEAIMDHEL
jgi:dihydropteroate synthase